MPSAAVLKALAQPGVRVRTLVRLRWFAILGQLLTLAIIGGYLGYALPLAPALAAIGASGMLNIGLAALYPRHARLTGPEALLHFGFDLVQLGVLLFLTGGLANPFAILLVVPVTISATLLPARATAVLVAVALLILVALWNWALPLPWGGHPIFLPPLYRGGIFLGLALTLMFVASYAWQVAAEARKQQLALAATQAALERESKMSALGSLAAAAAHELGGPLGTITLVANDLNELLGNDPVLKDDIKLLRQEVGRAREILTGIARRAEATDPFPQVRLRALLLEVAAPHQDGRGAIVEVAPQLESVEVARSPELLHGLSNLVDNAARHARTAFRLTAAERGRDLVLSVADDGPGFPENLLPKLGEPFLGPSRSGAGGTGLGIFIATTLLERTGAQLSFENSSDEGARVDIRWPLAHIAGATGTERTAWPALMPS